ncbi:MAG: YdcF family protein [Chloroflexota bacterium]
MKTIYPMSVLSTKRRLPRISRRTRLIFLVLVDAWLIFNCVIAVIIFVYGLPDRAQHEDVIVVLGAGLNRDLSTNVSTTRRAVRGAELWKQGYAPMIICSGGYATWSSRSEADGCAEVLRANGVPPDAIILEDRSRSTEENAFYSHQIMQTRGWKTALVVTDGYHLLRATWIFSAEGISGSTSPAATLSLGDLLPALIREVVALYWQVFKTILHLPVTYVPWW